MRTRLAPFVLFLAAGVPFLPLEAQEPVRLAAGWDHVRVGRMVEILPDPAGTFTLAEVQAAAPDRWKPSRTDSPNFAFDRSTYWLRFRVQSAAHESNVFFEVAQPMADYIDVHFVATGRPVVSFHTGDRRAFQTRPISHRNFLFPVELPAGETIQIYVRTRAHDGLHDPLLVSLWRPSAFLLDDFYRTAPMGGLLLVYLILAIYHVAIFFSLRDRAYIWFAGAIAGASFTLSLHWGFAQVLFLGSFPDLANHIFAPSIIFAEILLLQYARAFLETKKIAPVLDKILTAFMAVVCVGAVACLAVGSYSLANLWSTVMQFVNYALLIGAAVVVHMRGHRAARFFLYAFGALVVGICLHVINQIGLIDHERLADSAFYSGILLNILFLAVGLAARINVLREEKEIATRESAESLARQNEQLRALDQLKDEFLANTSHELRTPLHGIIGITESMLEATPGPAPETAHNLRLVAQSGRRLSRLVDDILDFSKMQHGDLALHRRSVDLPPILSVVIALSRPLLAEKPIEISTQMEPGLPPLYADEDRLQQILYNLLGNAIKFTKQGSIRVTAERLPGAGPGIVEITVADTGIGIPRDRKDAIFDSFTQADGSISREYGGTGLGLAVTKNLVELHGGKIRAESEPGAGTQIIFSIPASSEAAEVDETPRRRPEKVEGARTPILSIPELNPSAPVARTPKSERIPGSAEIQNPSASSELRHALIVDDDPVNLQVLRNQLFFDQIQTTSAHNGREALRLLDEQPFDIVLLDVMMPGLTGYDVCRIIRENHSHSELPVIMLTAKNRLHDLEAALEFGASDYLSKPFEARELRARVRTMLALRDAARTQSKYSALRAEIELARRIQQSLIPDVPPVIPGLRTAAHYRAMESIGGDFYDFRASHGRLAVLMADVSGHGVPAALIVSMVHLAFWFQKENLESPDIIFGRMNEILYGNTGDEFVTASYLHIDVATRELVVGNAGHPPLLLWRKRTQTLIKSRPFGRILGILPAPAFEAERIQLEEGDRILIYTDGALEAPEAHTEENFGEQRLEAALRNSEKKDTDEFVADLIQTLLDWSGGPEKIDDDIAIVAVDVVDHNDSYVTGGN